MPTNDNPVNPYEGYTISDYVSGNNGYIESTKLLNARKQNLTDSKVYKEIALERIRAHNKHNAKGLSVEDKGAYYELWLPILTEEIGEVARVLCDQDFETGMMDLVHLREELVQVCAMAAAWIDSIDRESKECD